MYSVMAAATGQASCVLREMGLGPRDRCTAEIHHVSVSIFQRHTWERIYAHVFSSRKQLKNKNNNNNECNKIIVLFLLAVHFPPTRGH